MPANEQTARDRTKELETEAFLAGLENIPDIPTLPAVAVKMNELLQDPEITVKAVSDTIEKDQAIVSRLLRLVNSAFYGFRSKIETIPHAVTLLGYNTVRNAVVSIAIIKSFASRKAAGQFDITEFWKHSLAVAVTGRHLAARNRICAADEAFVAGILHDVGKVVLAHFFEELFCQVCQAMKEEDLTFRQAERFLLPADHALIGRRMAQKWQLPPRLVEAVAYHHKIEDAASENGLALIAHAADFVVNNYMIDPEEEPDLSGLSAWAAEKLGTDLEKVSEWFPEAREDIDSACGFFLEQES